MFLGLGQATLILAQNIPAQAGAQGGVQGGFPQAQQNQSQNQQASIRPNYILGANDQILVRAPEVDELNLRLFRIDPDGFVTLPLIAVFGPVGQTVQALEMDITGAAASGDLIREPQITITAVQFHSEPSLRGGRVPSAGNLSVRRPHAGGALLTSAGGTLPDASRRIKGHAPRRIRSIRCPTPW